MFRLSDSTRWGHPGTLTICRILALPGDRLSLRGGVYVVNGEPTSVFASPRPQAFALHVPTEPDALTVGAGEAEVP